MNDAEVAIAAVTAAARVVREQFGRASKQVDKGGGDFATSADVEGEQAMRSVLRAERVDDAILGEEAGLSGGADGARIWLLDPLCGTLNYAAGMSVVAVNAALLNGGESCAAAVADPFADEAFWTDGRSVSVRRAGTDVRAVPSADTRLVDLNLDPPFPNAERFRAVALAADDEFGSRFRPRVVSSTLALAWVATGQRAAYVTDGNVHGSVHFAAGLALCEAAGCQMSDVYGEPLQSSENGLIVAADDATHAELLRLARKQLG